MYHGRVILELEDENGNVLRKTAEVGESTIDGVQTGFMDLVFYRTQGLAEDLVDNCEEQFEALQAAKKKTKPKKTDGKKKTPTPPGKTETASAESGTAPSKS